MADRRLAKIEREIERNVPVREPGACWIWCGTRNEKGYGTSWFGRAHRLVYEMLVGPIPDGKELDHTCRNRLCCNPAHLEPVTHQENVVRSPETMAGINARKTHCSKGHPLFGENMRIDMHRGRPTRTCRVCFRERSRKWKLKVAFEKAQA